jgi:hypothetical protein
MAMAFVISSRLSLSTHPLYISELEICMPAKERLKWLNWASNKVPVAV